MSGSIAAVNNSFTGRKIREGAPLWSKIMFSVPWCSFCSYSGDVLFMKIHLNVFLWMLCRLDSTVWVLTPLFSVNCGSSAFSVDKDIFLEFFITLSKPWYMVQSVGYRIYTLAMSSFSWLTSAIWTSLIFSLPGLGRSVTDPVFSNFCMKLRATLSHPLSSAIFEIQKYINLID